jgi:hypothetical protein
MKPGLVAVDLKLAMQQVGCPLCRVRDEAEYKYLYFLLHEYVNDGSTRSHIVASLGFCPRHVWQMGRMESGHFGDALGNGIIYESLAQVVHNRLARYLKRAESTQRPARRKRLLQRPRHLPFPDELQPQAACRVCQSSEQTEQAHLHWLLEGLADAEPDFRDWYLHSDRLCLRHLRQSLETVEPETEAGALFLARDALERLAALRADLEGYVGKHAWDRRDEGMTEGEKNSWLRALRFFGGKERNEDGQRPG